MGQCYGAAQEATSHFKSKLSWPYAKERRSITPGGPRSNDHIWLPTLSNKAELSFVCFFFLAGVACAQVQSGSTVPTVEIVLTRMAQARAENRASLRSYTVTRDYRLLGKENSTESEVIADVTYIPPDVKRYTIRDASGTGLGEKIVRQMLEHEVELLRNYSSTEISTANYDFRFLGEEDASGARCYVLELLPHRKDKNLLRGKIWVDTGTYLLHRAEGEPAKLMEERYRQHSTIITTNLVYDEWPNFLGSRPMVEALLSRLRHFCHTVAIDGPSLRELQG